MMSGAVALFGRQQPPVALLTAIGELKLDVAQVSRILGHNRPSVTLDTYTHLFNHATHAADIRQRMASSSFGALIG